MNVNIALPTITPTQLQPQVEMTVMENQRAVLIPQAQQSGASHADQGVGSQKERVKQQQVLTPSSRDGQQIQTPTLQNNTVVDAIEGDGQQKQQDAKQHANHDRDNQGGAKRGGNARIEQRGRIYDRADRIGLDNQLLSQDSQEQHGIVAPVRVSLNLGATLLRAQQIREHVLSRSSSSQQKSSRSVDRRGSQVVESLVCDVVNQCMEARNQVIAARYYHAVRPAAQGTLGLAI